ncbi:IS6 family transposase [Natrinema sp. 74]|uniref:IS6 family transposase n=1 Tax=Natrinema sp. 74 TaxID=3384159 RepID=UPI0038D46A2F
MYAENARLGSSIGQFDLDFVEREATPQLLMKLSIQLHLAGVSLSNTVRFLEIFDVERAQSTVHSWVHKADLQPDSCRSPDHVAVDETVIRLNDDQYWLYAAVDPESNKSPHTKIDPTRTKVIASTFFTELREKHDVDDAVFLVNGDKSLNYACQRHGLYFRYERHGNRNSVEHIFREIKRRISYFSNCFSNAHAETADQWLRSFAFVWN